MANQKNTKLVDFCSLNNDDTLCELLGNGLIAVITYGNNSKEAVLQSLEAYVTLKLSLLADDSGMLDILSARLLGKIAIVGFEGSRERANEWIAAQVRCIELERGARTIPAPAPEFEPENVSAVPLSVLETWRNQFDQEDVNIRDVAGRALAEVRSNVEMETSTKSRLLALVNQRIQLLFVEELGDNPTPDQETSAVARARQWVDTRLASPRRERLFQKKIAERDTRSQPSTPSADVTAPDARLLALN